jgi:DNA polymerase-3 subunit epsilon/CBS domain-containing protein
MSKPPVFVPPSMSLASALKLLMQRKISSVFVSPAGAGVDGPQRAVACGIVTERDLLRVIESGGAKALANEVGAIASRPLAAVPAGAFVYRAIGRMDRLKVRHLGVVDEAGVVVGALSARQLLRMRAQDAVALGDAIDEARDVHALGAAWAKLPAVARGLLDEGVEARAVAAVISHELAGLTRRAAEIGEARMREAGHGAPPQP